MKLAQLFEDQDTADMLLKQVQRLIALSDPYTGSGGDPVHFHAPSVDGMYEDRGRVINAMSSTPTLDNPRVTFYYLSGNVGEKYIEDCIAAYETTLRLHMEASTHHFSIGAFANLDLTHKGDHWMLS